MIRKLRPFSRFGSSTLLASLIAAALLVVLGEGSASAQAAKTFGERGQIAVTAENLFGLSFDRFGYDQSSGERSIANTRFGLLMGDRSSAGAVFKPTGPWVGVHYFVIPSLSVGASLGFEWESGSTTRPTGTNATQTTDTASRASFVFAPKVGYALMLTDMMGFWFRGGPTIARTGYSDPNDTGSSSVLVWMLSADALFVLTPVQHFAFFVGPQANLSFAGTYAVEAMNTTTSWDAGFRNFAIGAGFIGYFDF